MFVAPCATLIDMPPTEPLEECPAPIDMPDMVEVWVEELFTTTLLRTRQLRGAVVA